MTNRNFKHKSIKKLKSEEGVSILFALLVLLVCTVIASIILTAATAAGGRTSEMEKMDQRYYSVMSSVNMIRDMYDGAELEVDKLKKTVTTETTEINTLTGQVTTETKSEDTYQFVFDPETDNILLNDAMMMFVFGTDSDIIGDKIVKEYDESSFLTDKNDTYKSIYEAGVPAISNSIEKNLTLTHGSEMEDFNVAITSTFSTDGNIKLVFVNDNSDKDKYKISLMLNAKKEEGESSEVLSSETKNDTSGDVTTVKTVTTTLSTKSVSITWEAGAMRKLQ